MKRTGQGREMRARRLQRPMDKPERDAAKRKAVMLKALAHPLRVALFERIGRNEVTVTELCDHTGTKEPSVSRHLAVMRAAGLLETRKEGLKVFYSLKMPCLLPVLSCIDQAVCEMADESARAAECLRR